MGDEFPRVKVAAVHVASEFLDRERCVDKECGLIAKAGRARRLSRRRSCRAIRFGSGRTRRERARPLFAELFRNALKLSSEATRQIGAVGSDPGPDRPRSRGVSRGV